MTKTKRTDNDDIYFMRTKVWRDSVYDALRDIFASIYAGDGEHTRAEAMAILSDSCTRVWDDILDDGLLEAVWRIDRFVLDLLLPLHEHLDFWREHDEIGWLLDDLGKALSTLAPMIIGDEALEALPPRDGTESDLADQLQRCMAYRVVQAMVMGSESVTAELAIVTSSVKRNLGYLLDDDNLEHRDLVIGGNDYLYRSMSYSSSGMPVCGAEYWAEPLMLVSEAATATGHEAIVVAAVDDVIAFLESFETERYTDTRNDIIRRLTKHRKNLGAEPGCTGMNVMSPA